MYSYPPYRPSPPSSKMEEIKKRSGTLYKYGLLAPLFAWGLRYFLFLSCLVSFVPQAYPDAVAVRHGDDLPFQ